MSSERATSIVEIGAVRPLADRYDVAILGGGLAGLTLAIQLKARRPETSVTVLEKREGPAPLAAFKVGESTVPSGAHYFADVVGMADHLRNEQLIKCGLRYWLPRDGNRDVTGRVEVGAPSYPPHDNFQIDRGLFENKLAARARSVGVDLAQGARVKELVLGGNEHQVSVERFGDRATTSARWVVDASGRASLLKRQLSLGTDCGHHINSSWFRLSGGLDIEDWGRDDEAWMKRVAEPGIRKFSTNHLMGEGYWVWLIPLSSGPISIGVCADPRFHPFEEINEFGRLLEWLRKHEPQLAAAVENRVEDVEDFLRVQDFAYGVERILSPERWALIGEAGAFADPFYSPGSDFICYGNTFAADVISRDLDGEDIEDRLTYFNDLYQRMFEHVVSRYRDSYTVFGNPLVASALLAWDAYSGHNGMVLLCVMDKLTDLEFMQSVDADLDRLFKLNINIHKLFRQWNGLEHDTLEPGMTGSFPLMVQALFGLVQESPTDDALREQLKGHVRASEAMAVAIFHRAARSLPDPPASDKAVNPYAVGLDPESWESDGLYDPPALTLSEAQSIVPGIEGVFKPSASPPGPPGGLPPGPPGMPGGPPGGPPGPPQGPPPGG